MRRFVRHVLTLCSAVSFMLCVAVCTLWVWSYSSPAGAVLLGRRHDHMLDAHGGFTTYVRQSHDSPTTITPGRPFLFWNGRYHSPEFTRSEPDVSEYYEHPDYDFALSPPPYTKRFSFGGVSYLSAVDARWPTAGYGGIGDWDRWGVFLAAGNHPDSGIAHQIIVRLPHWLIALATAVWPALALLHRLRNRARRKQGLCRSCGYDLRASPGRCPECGTAAALADV